MLSINSIHVRFEMALSGIFCRKEEMPCSVLVDGGALKWQERRELSALKTVWKNTFWESPKKGEAPNPPVVMNTGIADFNSTFPTRIHAFLEDIINKVPKEFIRSSEETHWQP